MSIKEKKLLKTNLRIFTILIAIYVMVQIAGTTILGKEFKDYLFTWEWQEDLNSLEPEQLRFEFDKEGIVNLGDVTKEDGWIVYRLTPGKAGLVEMTVYNNETGETLMSTYYRVRATGLITDMITGNFTNYRMHQLNICFLSLAMTILLWVSFIYAQTKLRFSYQAIFYSGLALWLSMVTILLFRLWLKEELMVEIYNMLQSAPSIFMLYTAVPLLLFCISLTVSNLSLIKHEGFRTRNALGIVLSVVIIVGELFLLVLGFIFPAAGSRFQISLIGAVVGVYGSVYACMECFLLGAVLCGSLAARHEPEYDMDYLIILGCKVKPDGSLYPLIRGRVDRAILFYKKQLEKTGKKAVFIPSGGQGSDEIISEAAAMKRYLLEQGIPEEQILAEDQSKNTVQNMKFSKKLIDERRPGAKVAFSTTNFHVFRSGIISRQNDFEPDGMGSKTKWYFWPNAYMREVIGMMVYKWKSIVIVMVPIVLFMVAIQFIG